MLLESDLAALHLPLPLPLLRFAQRQLRNDSMSEDLGSETFLAMLEMPGSFEGRSTLRTCATGILKFKVIDALRQRGREVHIEPLDEPSLDDAMGALGIAFNHCGVMLYRARMQWRECLERGWFNGAGASA